MANGDRIQAAFCHFRHFLTLNELIEMGRELSSFAAWTDPHFKLIFSFAYWLFL